jgi:hypothetical protein
MKIPHWWINIAQLPESLHDIQDIMNYLSELRFFWVRLEFDFLHPIDITYTQELVSALHTWWYRIIGTLLSLTPGTLDSLCCPKEIYSAWHSYKYDQFIEFAHTTINQFRAISVWQVANEWNTRRFRWENPDPVRYYTLYQTIAKSFPDRHIIAGAIFENFSWWSEKIGMYHSLKTLFTKKIIPDWLVDVSLHPYDDRCYVSCIASSERYSNRVITNLKRMQDMIALYSEKVALWVTEFWISRKRTRLSPEQTARTYLDIFQYCATQYIPFFIRNLYDFPNTRHHRLNPERYFWLIGDDGTRNPLYYELQKKLVWFDTITQQSNLTK